MHRYHTSKVSNHRSFHARLSVFHDFMSLSYATTYDSKHQNKSDEAQTQDQEKIPCRRIIKLFDQIVDRFQMHSLIKKELT